MTISKFSRTTRRAPVDLQLAAELPPDVLYRGMAARRGVERRWHEHGVESNERSFA